LSVGLVDLLVVEFLVVVVVYWVDFYGCFDEVGG